jgi:hypothetical protein
MSRQYDSITSTKGIKIPLKPKETFQTTTQSQPRTSYRPKQQIPTKQGFRDQKKRTTPALNKDWIPSHILKDLDMFCTAAFLIRTWTEEVVMLCNVLGKDPDLEWLPFLGLVSTVVPVYSSIHRG